MIATDFKIDYPKPSSHR